ncbi:hypothetical protein MBLNU459_g2384t1 [Dothideomycetes sp. NU459]
MYIRRLILIVQAASLATSSAVPIQNLALAEYQNKALDTRAPAWIQSQWVKGPIALAAGAAVQGRQVWDDMISSCGEWNGDKKVASRVDCVYDAVLAIVRLGISSYGVYTGAQSAANAFIGVAKRDNSTTLAATLITMGPDALTIIDDITPTIDQLQLLHIAHGVEVLDNSVTLGYGHPDAGVQLQHVTNGTHGFVQSVNTTTPSGAEKRDTYSWNNYVAGLKFSYSSTCANNNYYDNSPEGQSLRWALYNFAYWTANTVTADKYIVEFSNPSNNDANYLLGTIIAESGGYGNNYEGFPYQTEYGC